MHEGEGQVVTGTLRGAVTLPPGSMAALQESSPGNIYIPVSLFLPSDLLAGLLSAGSKGSQRTGESVCIFC